MKVILLDKTCEAYPAQWEGKLEDGRMIYIRYRGGYLEISISKKSTDDIWDAVDGIFIYNKKIKDDYHGEMTFERLKELTSDLIDYSKIKGGNQ